MKPDRSELTRATYRTPLVLALALVLLAALAGTVWAAWGAALVRASGQSGEATATPTRTPRPVTPAPTTVSVALDITPVATPQPTAVPEPAVTPEPMPAWLADVVADYGMDASRRFVVVDLDTQKMIVWDPDAGPQMAGRPLREMPVSTGDETRGYRTLAWYGLVGDYWGTFHSFGVYADEGWYLFEDAGSILIHGAPYKLVDGEKVYEDMAALGAYPASRGCIRLAPEDARWFTEWQPQGAPLVILPKSTP